MPLKPEDFSHPNVGTQVEVDQHDKHVMITFVCDDQETADSLFESMLEQLNQGFLHVAMQASGPPVKIEKGPSKQKR